MRQTLLFHLHQQSLPGVPQYPLTEAPLLLAPLCALLSSITGSSQSSHHWHGCVDAPCFAGIARSGRRSVFLTPGAAADLSEGFELWTWLQEFPGNGKKEVSFTWMPVKCLLCPPPGAVIWCLMLLTSWDCYKPPSLYSSDSCPELLCPSSAQGRYFMWKISIE